MSNCPSSPSGKHDPVPDTVEVIIKGKKERRFVMVCFWCGKIM